MDTNNTMGMRIKGLREQRHETQKDIAKAIGTTRATISRYETGEREPDYGTIIALAQYFGVSTDYLLGVTDVPNAGLLTDDTGPSIKFVPENVDLIRGAMSYEEMSRDICAKIDDPLYKSVFNTAYLKKLAKGTMQATPHTVNLLADYARVEPSFFYRTNTAQDLENVRKGYAEAGAPESRLDDGLKEFVRNNNNLAYIKLMMYLKDLNIGPGKVEELIEDFLKNPKDWKYIELAKDMKGRGIDPDEINGFSLKYDK